MQEAFRNDSSTIASCNSQEFDKYCFCPYNIVDNLSSAFQFHPFNLNETFSYQQYCFNNCEERKQREEDKDGSQYWENQSQESSISGYCSRKDVVFKATFRHFRKFLVKDFRQFFNYTKCNKSTNIVSSPTSEGNNRRQGVFERKIRRYVELKLSPNDVDEMVTLLF